MNMDLDYINSHKLGPDDTFDFKCRQCGKCCHNRDDLLFTGLDVFRITKYLGIQPIDVIAKNCEVYIGDNSQIPVVHVLPKSHDGVCPFLRSGKCSVHAAKPVVCAVFPLARVHASDSNEAFYVLQEDVSCGEKGELHTIRDWLGSFQIQVNDSDGKLWSEAVIYCATYMIKKKAMNSKRKQELWNEMFCLLYLAYDIHKEFAPQLSANLEQIKALIK